MTDWIDAYTDTDDLNEKYGHLRTQIATLRARRDDIEYFDEDAVLDDVRELDDTIDGHLIVFLANDFGRPRAYRPSNVDRDAQNDIREALLQHKYDDTNDHLNQIRNQLLHDHPGIHKIIAAEYSTDEITYHLPEGTNHTTNFITVREMVGLIDYTTNSFQNDGLSKTY